MGLRRAVLAFLLVLAAAASPALVQARTGGEVATVAYVVDGDTLDLASGARVRLLQIDTPEVGTGECYSRAAARDLRRLLPVGARVGLEADERLDRVDRYGRLLRYVRARGRTSTSSSSGAAPRPSGSTTARVDGTRGRSSGPLGARERKGEGSGAPAASRGTRTGPRRRRRETAGHAMRGRRGAIPPTRTSASRLRLPTSTAATSVRRVSASSAPIRTASTATGTGSAASDASGRPAAQYGLARPRYSGASSPRRRDGNVILFGSPSET